MTAERRQIIAASASLGDAAKRLGISKQGVRQWMIRNGMAKCWTHTPQPDPQMDATRISWECAKRRCRSPRNVSFKWYGAKGITFDPRWDDFAQFVADVGLRPDGTTLDRIDSSKNYEPGNCRWVSMKTQQRNRGNNKRFEYAGENLTLSEIAERVGVKKGTLYNRVSTRGMSIAKAIQLPVIERQKPKKLAA
jgi:hypothetical protein